MQIQLGALVLLPGFEFDEADEKDKHLAVSVYGMNSVCSRYMAGL